MIYFYVINIKNLYIICSVTKKKNDISEYIIYMYAYIIYNTNKMFVKKITKSL